MSTPPAEPAPAAAPTRARVVVLSGPSGAGKSRLAARLHRRYGWPVVRLDDFYRDLGDPLLPVSAQLGIPDWDDPRSWDAGAAVAALEALVDTGTASTPVYDISVSRATGRATVTAGPQDVVVAEGIFAAEIIAALRERGLLAAAYCVRNRPVTTFVRRLARDLAERRKPPAVLVRRGVVLMRAEPALVARLAGLGARPRTATQAEAECADLAVRAQGG